MWLTCIVAREQGDVGKELRLLRREIDEDLEDYPLRRNLMENYTKGEWEQRLRQLPRVWYVVGRVLGQQGSERTRGTQNKADAGVRSRNPPSAKRRERALRRTADRDPGRISAKVSR